jgi:hypothetical protein
MSQLDRRAVWAVLSMSACVGFVDEPPRPLTMTITTTTHAMDAGLDGGAVVTPGVDAGPSSTPDAGPADPCAAVQCQSGAHCVQGHCACNAGFIADAGMCFPGDPGIPALRSREQVCEAYRRGMVVTDSSPFSKSSAMCDPGVVSRAGIDDMLNRLAMFRYLAGLGPVNDDAADNERAQGCALVSAWNPAGPQAHFPQPSATCYTAAGAAGAGSSNIAWGCGSPANSIDQWMDDYGNDTTFGHRRWLLNPPLGPIGFGFYVGGNNYGSAACLGVFGSSGGGPSPRVVAFPPPGFVPANLCQTTWTAQGDLPFQDAGITVTGASGTNYPASLYFLQGSYGNSGAVRIDRNGWSPMSGETYHVVISGEGHEPVTYDVMPIDCP